MKKSFVLPLILGFSLSCAPASFVQAGENNGPLKNTVKAIGGGMLTLVSIPILSIGLASAIGTLPSPLGSDTTQDFYSATLCGVIGLPMNLIGDNLIVDGVKGLYHNIKNRAKRVQQKQEILPPTGSMSISRDNNQEKSILTKKQAMGARIISATFELPENPIQRKPHSLLIHKRVKHPITVNTKRIVDHNENILEHLGLDQN